MGLKQTELVSKEETNQLLTTDLLKLHSRVWPDAEATLEDPLFVIYCDTAEQKIESICEYVIRKKTFKLVMEDWPLANRICDRFREIRIEHAPVLSVSSVKYYDKDNTLQTVSSSDYEGWLSNSPPLIVVKNETIAAQTLTSERTKRIEIQYIAGNLIADVSPIAKLLTLQLVAFWFGNREAYGRLPAPDEGAYYRSMQPLIDTLRWRLF